MYCTLKEKIQTGFNKQKPKEVDTTERQDIGLTYPKTTRGLTQVQYNQQRKRFNDLATDIIEFNTPEIFKNLAARRRKLKQYAGTRSILRGGDARRNMHRT